MATWQEMRRSDFDARDPLTLFDSVDVPLSPDVLAWVDKQTGTPALFGTEEE